MAVVVHRNSPRLLACLCLGTPLPFDLSSLSILRRPLATGWRADACFSFLELFFFIDVTDYPAGP